MDELKVEIKRIATLLDELRKADDATYEYQGVCDALVWSDELPSKRLDDELAIRYLFQYRTSVILGEPIESIEPYWIIARSSFPNWPGFSTERCQKSESLSAHIQDARAKLEKFFDEEEAI